MVLGYLLSDFDMFFMLLPLPPNMDIESLVDLPTDQT